MERVRNRAGEVIEGLRQSGLDTDAARLEGLVGDLGAGAAAEAALQRIADLCHIRALGDRNVTDMSWQDWLSRLDRLRSACGRELKRLARENTEEGGG